ncbi:MAG: exodeoxyribonuclease VII large subunit [Ignavibacteriales bacterium]|nr:exodeoxyribonuclease VII large subunit [Ignavibacteriales bacterium]HPO55332.1 exodeoxyribonuclease VII large subunit [Ignavibacteriaceae bacterium]
MDNLKIITVSQLTFEIKRLLEENFQNVSLIGEISNFKPHVSGHWYFSLKDAEAQISCTMWKGVNSAVFFTPQDGMKIVVTGKVTVYPPRGNYQLDVRSMKPAGIGELQLNFELLKERLKKEGLFDAERKRPIPNLPMKIGIATAIDGAAFRDMVSVAGRRFPLVELVVIPTSVQGVGAAESIVDSIKALNKVPEIELIIIGRGGGSIEDLWAFNEEIVARAVYNSRIPVISAVGHEVDFTISDFVADVRAATPTAAMELATVDMWELIKNINSTIGYLGESLTKRLKDERNRIKYFIQSYASRVPESLINTNRQRLDHTTYRLTTGLENRLEKTKSNLLLRIKALENHDLSKTLKKGFVIVRQNGKAVYRAKKLEWGNPFSMRFFDNQIEINNYEKE